MSSRILWIPTGAKGITIESRSVMPTLEKMQEYVQGYIEVVNVLFNNGPAQMIVNEEGILKQLNINLPATSVYHAASIVQKGEIPTAYIHGNAILLDGIRFE